MASTTALSSLSTALSSVASTMTSMPSPSAMSPPTMTSASPSATPTNNPNDGGGSGKPLLFFVALGFGVVFTNLWIIVGVKYCFRYNQRHRQQIDHETGEPIDLASMPRPRRRREKKLMTMDEVNERFPLTKYKNWRATREQEGLPAAGGVTAPPSRAGSIKDTMLERMSTEQDGASFAESSQTPALGKTASTNHDPSSSTTDFAAVHGQAEEHLNEKTNIDEKHKTDATTVSIDPSASTPIGPDDEEDPISTAVPQELLHNPGDACAICIDNLDDDDEIRGLTCGHAFHAGCLDPWLTSRRACCPLCKADYYIPKQRAQNAEATDADPARADILHAPQHAWMGRTGPIPPRSRVVFNGSRFHVDHHERFGFPVLVRERPQRHQQQQQQQLGDNVDTLVTGSSTGAPSDQDQPPPRQGLGARTLSMFRSVPGRFRPNHEAHNSSSAALRDTSRPVADTDASPGQMEAGHATI